MTTERKIALFLDRENVHERLFFEGVQRYACQTTGWRTYSEEGILGLPIGELRNWSGDGIIGFLRDKTLARAIQKANIPAVNVSSSGSDMGIPCVMQDYEKCGRNSAEYFIRRGFKHFGFFSGIIDAHFERRYKGFRERIEKDGFACRLFSQPGQIPAGSRWSQYQEDLTEWLRSLPKPVAIMALQDRFAARILAICEIAGFQVPEEIAVMGWGDDEIICPFTHPPLTSVNLRWEETGYVAAELLDRLMRGEKPPDQLVLIEPGRIVERQSSDVLAVGDPLVAQAVGFIEDHACDPITVEDVVRHVSINRRRLERLFRRALHRPPNTEIIRIRIQRVRELLTQTDMPMSEIARTCGYPDHRCLGITFRREMGVSPTSFRKQTRRQSERKTAAFPRDAQDRGA